jgi:asparagine synthase (glutamine-hydrolysing)
VPKPLLVGALGNALPDAVVHRGKQGFTLPFEHWLRGELRANVANGIQNMPEGALRGRIQAEGVRKVWDSFLAGRTSWSRPWSLYVLSKWCELNL